MTVAAVILADSPELALADAEGVPRVRRLAASAWAGGAFPVVVVAPDPEGAVAQALAGAPVTLAEPAPFEGGPVAQIVRGIEVAAAEVTETDAVIVCPAQMVWVDPETMTSLIEAHGIDPEPLLAPTYRGDVGWPVLVPLGRLESLRGVGPDRMPDGILDDLRGSGILIREIDLGDPGTVHDASVGRVDMPPFEGPPEPTSGHAHEWGAPAADRSDDAPIEGPTISRYGAPGSPHD